MTAWPNATLHRSPLVLAEATFADSIFPARSERAPQRLIGLGTWAPKFFIERDEEPTATTASSFKSSEPDLDTCNRVEAGDTTPCEEVKEGESRNKDTSKSEVATDDEEKEEEEEEGKDSNSYDSNGNNNYDSNASVDTDSDDDEHNNNKTPLADHHYSPSQAFQNSLETQNTWTYLRHSTISRDQTQASSFEVEKLAALRREHDHHELGILPDETVQGNSLRPSSGDAVLIQYLLYGRERPMQSHKQEMVAERLQENTAAGTTLLEDHKMPPLSPGRADHGLGKREEQPTIQAQGPFAEIANIEEQIEKLRNLQNTLKSTSWLVLHKIQDEETSCLTKPSWALEQRRGLHYRGNSPLASEAEFLRQRSDIAFVVYRHYEREYQSRAVEKAREEGTALPDPVPARDVIQPLSKQMISALDAFFGYHPSFKNKFPGWRSQDPLHSPFLFWYCYRSAERLESMPEPERLQMRLLAEWIDRNYSHVYAEVDNKFSLGHVSASAMPFLVQPGEVLVSTNDKGIHGYIAESWPRLIYSDTSPISQPRKAEQVSQRWRVDAWSYGYDGQFYRLKTTLDIDLEFEKDHPDVDIATLRVLPLRFGTSEFRAKLGRRGRMLWACRNSKLIACKDKTDTDLTGEGERYMIDFKTCKQLHSDSPKFRIAYPSLNSPERVEMDATVMERDDPPQNEELFVFPSTFIGYNLRQKKWQDLQVDLVQEVHWNKQAFKHLVIDEEIKDIIQALVASKLDTDHTTDLIEGKGNGLIILLHGGPGTGKTFTAESVAELAEKPLFRVTCGDIGTKPEAVEKYLESVLHLGKIWGCVVLLDEADVFLEQRTLTDLKRNALVSVFLRVLKYYKGILILTSNRVGTFNEAFKSHIQLSLHYKALTKSQRCIIWMNFLNRLRTLEEETPKIGPIDERKRKLEDSRAINFEDIERHLADLANEEMNGRQIRNAITTARQLTKFKEERMTYRHLEHVIRISRKFDKYLEKVRDSYTDDQVAREEGIR